MTYERLACLISKPSANKLVVSMLLLVMVLVLPACSPQPVTTNEPTSPQQEPSSLSPPSPDPRIGLGAGLFDAEEAIWNMEVVSQTPPPEPFVGATNSDLAFTGNFVIQGNYNGIQIWDVSNPGEPDLVTEYVCPASQSDVSVYQDLLFVSGEGLGGRLDCGTEGVQEQVSEERLRGIRIFDISDIENPEYIGNVQTCRGSHTHSVLKDPDDDEHVYIYVSGSAPVRPAEELEGCTAALPDEDPDTALFRIEVIEVPLSQPELASIVSSPRIFEDLEAPPEHGLAPADLAEVERAQEEGELVVEIQGQPQVVPSQVARQMLQAIVEDRGGTGEPTAADSTALKNLIAERFAGPGDGESRPGPTQCHDITLYPDIGLAGGACEGYGLLLDIEDPRNPVRIDAVADSNFAYWHSATFNYDGSKVLFTDEWGGGGQPKCRASDPAEWGANAIFTIENRQMDFRSYYKLPAAQTPQENCVAHNGSLIPVPGRDVMVQAWYQGGISVFDWTDPDKPVEIAFHDRGPIDPDQMVMGGSWSVYWYNGLLISSEIARGLDIFELTPSAHLSENEIAAANTVELAYLNAQGQPTYNWPPSFALIRAYIDQIERSNGLPGERISSIRQHVDEMENASANERREGLLALSSELEQMVSSVPDSERVRKLTEAVRELATS